jgi:hypothetical protein
MVLGPSLFVSCWGVCLLRRELPAGWKKFTLSEGTYLRLSACGDGRTEQLVVGRFSTATQPSGTGVRVANPST